MAFMLSGLLVISQVHEVQAAVRAEKAPVQKRIKGAMWSNDIWHFCLPCAPCGIGDREAIKAMDVDYIETLKMFPEPFAHVRRHKHRSPIRKIPVGSAILTKFHICLHRHFSFY